MRTSSPYVFVFCHKFLVSAQWQHSRSLSMKKRLDNKTSVSPSPGRIIEFTSMASSFTAIPAPYRNTPSSTETSTSSGTPRSKTVKDNGPSTKPTNLPRLRYTKRTCQHSSIRFQQLSPKHKIVLSKIRDSVKRKHPFYQAPSSMPSNSFRNFAGD